jgi:DNA-directed RNA polymerase I, II, and III subunit RPABC2
MDELRAQSRILHPEVLPAYRDEKAEERLTLPYFTKYEYTVLLGIRTQQLADGAKPLVDIKDLQKSDPRFLHKVAEKEIVEQKLPFIVNRRMPSGKSEKWLASELSLIW